jgi:hypothetical protein
MDRSSCLEALSCSTGKPPALWGLPFLSVRLLRESRSSVSYPTTRDSGDCGEEAMTGCSEREVARARSMIRFVLRSADPPF